MTNITILSLVVSLYLVLFQYASVLGGIVTWQQLGTDIDGKTINGYFGGSVSLSNSGTTLAVGAKGANTVRVYEYNTTNWVQLGSDIHGENGGDLFGNSVYLSGDGEILAVGAPYNDDNGYIAGHVRVYKYNIGTWVQLGADIDGEAAEDRSGVSVSLSNDGTILAVGANYNVVNKGHVRVYAYNGTIWLQLGSDIDGEAAGDLFGYSISLSHNGTILAVGAIANDGNANNAGHVRVYEYNGGI